MSLARPLASLTGVRRALAMPAMSGVGAASCAFFLYALILIALFWPTFVSMGSAWISSSSYAHGALVAPLSLWLIRTQRAQAAPAAIWPAACIGMALAGALWLAGHAASVNLVKQAALVTLVIAGACLFFGRANVSRFWMPLALLYFMVPFGDSLLPALQSITAHAVTGLLKASAVSASLDGLIITTPSGRYAIAEACAGLNFLLAAALVAAAFSMHAISNWRRRVGFVAFATAFALLANIARAYLVVLAATLTDGAYRIGADHIVFGWAFYGVMLFALVAVGRMLTQAPTAVAPAKTEAVQPARLSAPALTVALALLILIQLYASAVIDRDPKRQLPSILPPFSVPGWRLTPAESDWSPTNAATDRLVRIGYAHEDLHVLLAVSYTAYERAGAEIAGYDSRPADGLLWRVTGSTSHRLRIFGGDYAPAFLSVENAAGRRLQIVTLYWLGARVFDRRFDFKVAQGKERLVGIQSQGGVIYLAAGEDSGSAPAREAITRFAATIEPLETWLARVESYGRR